jgi:hypothetical protein
LPIAAPLVLALLVTVRAFPKGAVIVDNNSNMAISVTATILVATVLATVATEVLFFFFFLIFSNTKAERKQRI